MYFDGVGMHEYESVAIDLDEQQRLVRDLGNFKAMILRNHGLLAVGADGLRSLYRVFWLERAARPKSRPWRATPPAPSGAGRHRQDDHLYLPETRRRWVPLEWPALLRLADRKYPGFRD